MEKGYYKQQIKPWRGYDMVAIHNKNGKGLLLIFRYHCFFKNCSRNPQ